MITVTEIIQVRVLSREHDLHKGNMIFKFKFI